MIDKVLPSKNLNQLTILAVATVVTVVQRMVHVHRQAVAGTAADA